MQTANDAFSEEHPSLLIPASKINKPPSLADGFTFEEEYRYRNWGCELIQECGILLNLRQVVLATAQTLFHRFYYRRSMQQFQVHIVAMACLFLAAKVEEDARRVRDILNVMYSVKLTRQHKRFKILKLGGKLYVRWKTEVLRTERFILKELGFSMYNITEHPHKFILYYVAILEGSDALAQMAWNILNDSLRLPLCVAYTSQTIACAALFLASRAIDEPLPPLPWYEIFDTTKRNMYDVAEAILQLYEQPKLLWLPSLGAHADAEIDNDEDEPEALTPEAFVAYQNSGKAAAAAAAEDGLAPTKEESKNPAPHIRRSTSRHAEERKRYASRSRERHDRRTRSPRRSRSRSGRRDERTFSRRESSPTNRRYSRERHNDGRARYRASSRDSRSRSPSYDSYKRSRRRAGSRNSRSRSPSHRRRSPSYRRSRSRSPDSRRYESSKHRRYQR